MLRLVVRRLLQLPLILAAVFLTTFVLAWAVPGNPLEQGEGRRPSPEVAAAMKAQYNLDSPWRFLATYADNASGARWVRETLSGEARRREEAARAAGVAPAARRVFDLGPSLQYRDQRVSDIIASSLPVSVALGAAAMVVALVLGVGAGIVGAARPNSVADLATLTLVLVGVSVPNFVVGAGLLLWLGVLWPAFPLGEVSVRGMVLPTITLALPFAAYIARLMRMSLIETMSADFIRTARAKGVSERCVFLRHALKPAFLPVLSYLGPAAAGAMTGSFVVEKVFAVPGMGQHFVNAVLNKDLFLLLGVVLVYSTMLVLFNLVVDVLYGWVDPRIE